MSPYILSRIYIYIYNYSVNVVQVHIVLLIWHLHVCLPFMYLQDASFIFIPVYHIDSVLNRKDKDSWVVVYTLWKTFALHWVTKLHFIWTSLLCFTLSHVLYVSNCTSIFSLSWRVYIAYTHHYPTHCLSHTHIYELTDSLQFLPYIYISRVQDLNPVTILWLTYFDDWFELSGPFIKKWETRPLIQNGRQHHFFGN